MLKVFNKRPYLDSQFALRWLYYELLVEVNDQAIYDKNICSQVHFSNISETKLNVHRYMNMCLISLAMCNLQMYDVRFCVIQYVTFSEKLFLIHVEFCVL